jgi:Leucine-rich repeat (LRR) protein
VINAIAECRTTFSGLRLNLGSVGLAFTPFEIKSITSLRILNLRNNALTMFPSDIPAALNELEELNLAQNALTYLPENISAMSNLRNLSLSKNKLSALPMGLFQLPQLQILRLDNNLLNEVPGQIGDLSVLHTLILNNNNIRKIPTRATELKFLTKVDLSENPIDSCPPTIQVMHQKNELLLHKGKRRGLIKRSHVLKKTMDEQLENILMQEERDNEAAEALEARRKAAM